jgi:putative glutamine amidotransferase
MLSSAVRLVSVAAVLAAVASGFGCTSSTPPPETPKPAAAEIGKGESSAAAVVYADVLVTHPTANVLRRMVGLVERGIINIPSLRVVGLIYAGEWEDYASAERFVEQFNKPWLTLKRIDCALSPDTLYQQNPCTPVFEKLVQESRGIVFTGGADIPPAYYGEKTLLTTVLETPKRQQYELSLLYHLLGRGHEDGPVPLLNRNLDFSVLAICMGMQAANVATGGTLIQDIPSEVYGVTTAEDILTLPAEAIHRNPNYLLNPAPGVAWGSVHTIRLVGESPLTKMVRDASASVSVVSAHHQAAEKIGAGLRVVATSKDGRIVEAVVHERLPGFLGVQFHPDYLEVWDPKLPYAWREGDPETNIAAPRIAGEPDASALNRGLWQWLASRVAQAKQ